MPASWGGGARLQWYDDFGYENFFIVAGAYPDHAKKMIEIGGAQGYNKSRLTARAVEEGLYPHALLLGEDICSQQGPMVSPDFLKEFYAPVLKRGLEPLLAAGCRPVWHSDGNVRPLMDMLIDCGIQGFQGFQPECGMTLEFVLEHRTREGEPLIIFGPLAVTTELPVLSPGEIRERVRRAIRLCEGNARLVLFTSNTINPDIPLENIRAMYEAV
jgi:uroporphyrinogen decarboxylase